MIAFLSFAFDSSRFNFYVRLLTLIYEMLRKLLFVSASFQVSKRDGSANDRVMFLFSDILMYAKPLGNVQSAGDYSGVNAACKLQCCSILPLHHCRIERLFGLTQDANALMFKVSELFHTCAQLSLLIICCLHFVVLTVCSFFLNQFLL